MNSREKIQMKNRIEQIQARGDLFARQLMNEKQRIVQLQSKLSDFNRKIGDVRENNKKKAVALLNMHTTTTNDAYQRADGLDPTRLADVNQKKLLKTLESRLNKALVRKNEIENENNDIKSGIDKLRMKVCCDNTSRLANEKQLQNVQQKMDEIMEKAAGASEQRDKSVDQQNFLCNENAEEQQKFDKEYEELGVLLAARAAVMEESIAGTSNEMALKSHNETNCDAGCIDANSKNKIVGSEDDKLEEEISALEEENREHTQNLHRMEEKIQQYGKDFKRLQEISGLISTEEVISAFVKNEEETYSIFNFIQNLNEDTDLTLERYSSLKEEMEVYMSDQMGKENQRAKIVSKHKDILNHAQEEREKISYNTKEGKATVEEIAKKVESLFTKLKCNEMTESHSCSSRDKTNNDVVGARDGDVEVIIDVGVAQLSKHIEYQSGSCSSPLPSNQSCEQDLLVSMEQIEKRAMQIISQYAKKLTANKKHQRRPSMLMSPKTFDRLSFSPAPSTQRSTITMGGGHDSSNSNHRESLHMSSSNNNISNKPLISDDDDSDDEYGCGTAVVSLNEMRRQAAEKLTNSPRKISSANSQRSNIIRRHSVIRS